MKKQCKHPTCGDVCRRPAKQKKVYQLKRTPLKTKRCRIKEKSDRRKSLNKKYGPLARSFREDRPICQINAPGCTIETQGVHHPFAKESEDKYLDVRFFIAACNYCNTYCEANTEWAEDAGFKFPKALYYRLDELKLTSIEDVRQYLKQKTI